MSTHDILFSYLIIKAHFKFDDSIKYPSIPCYVDDTTTVYPLQGQCILTGAEYLSAKNQNCHFTFGEIFCIPFQSKTLKSKNDNDKVIPINHPFKEVIYELQANRRKYPKGSLLNFL